MKITDGISRAFVERLSSLGIDGEKLLDFLNLFSTNADGEKEKNDLTKILRDTQNCRELEKLSPDQSILLNQLFLKNLGVRVIPSDIKTISKKLISFVSSIVAFLVLIVTSVFLFAAILDGNSSNIIFANMPFVSSLIFLVLIALLFLLEGTQISITSLRLKDLEYLRLIDPKSHEFQRNYRYLDKVNEYLAGRQLFTIFCVFTISQIASFPELNRVPFTQIQFSSWFDKWIATPFLDFGFLGAIFTLWIGQLTPQFVAAKQPVSFLRNPLARLVVTSSSFINRFGVSIVPAFFAGRFQAEQEIPTSNREKLISYQESHGYVGLGLNLCWHITKDQFELKRIEEIEFFTQRIDLLRVTQAIPNIYKTEKLESIFAVNRAGLKLDVDIVDREEHHEFDSFILTSRVSPRHGGFLAGDVLSSTLEIISPRVENVSHTIRPTLPTRYLSIEIIVDSDVGIRAPRLLISEPEFLSESVSKETEIALVQTTKTNQQTRFHQFLMFPDNDVEYKVVWQLH